MIIHEKTRRISNLKKTKGMLKYRPSFYRNCEEKFEKYLLEVKNKTNKINTIGLYCYEIVRKILQNTNYININIFKNNL